MSQYQASASGPSVPIFMYCSALSAGKALYFVLLRRLYQQQNIKQIFGTSTMYLTPPPPPPVAKADVRSKAVVLLLLIRC